MAVTAAAAPPVPRIPALPPGPEQPRVVQAVLWALRGPEFSRAAHERFGHTFTLRAGTYPPTVITTERDAVRRLLTGDPLAKRHGNDVLRPMIGDRSVLVLEPAEHLERRKLLLGPFHGERVQVYARLVEELVERALDDWRPGQVVRVLPVARDVTLEVILRAVLGLSDERLRRRIGELVDDLVDYPLSEPRRWLGLGSRIGGGLRGRPGELLGALATLPSPAVLTYFPELKTRRRWNVTSWHWWTLRDRADALLDEHLDAVRADPRLADREDVLALLVQAGGEDGRALTTQDLRHELWSLINAGHETTAATIAWGAQLLAHHPEVQDRAAAAAADGDTAYVGALVKEVLRLRTPVPLAAVRELDEPFPIAEHLVPAGVPIAADGPNLHADPALWPEPAAFRPERFLDGAPEPYSWLPFGGGAHRCVGAALAELEARVALTALLRRFELRPAARRMESPARRAVVLVPHAGGQVRLAPRR